MSAELLSLFAGILIGLIYALLKARSPAPPAIALVGLLGMLIGEQITVKMLEPAHTTTLHTCPAQPAATASLNTACSPGAKS